MEVLPGDLDDPRVRSLLEHHLATARAATPPGSDHALGVEGLKAPHISFWTAWEGEMLLATGALKRLSSDHGEVNPCIPPKLPAGRESDEPCCFT